MAISFRNKYLTPFLLVIFLWGCETEYFSSIPDSRVYLEVFLDGLNFNLNTINESESFRSTAISKYKLGYGGILVFHGPDNFYAFDLSCPNEAKREIVVIREKDNILFYRCPTCKSRYDIASSGAKLDGPSRYPLKRYNGVSVTNNVVTIYN